jgi:hypothetical protein
VLDWPMDFTDVAVEEAFASVPLRIRGTEGQ